MDVPAVKWFIDWATESARFGPGGGTQPDPGWRGIELSPDTGVPFWSKSSPIRISRSNLTILVSLLLSLAIAGCGGSSGPSLEIPKNPTPATQTDLESLFGQITLQLQNAKPGSEGGQPADLFLHCDRNSRGHDGRIVGNVDVIRQ